ncbi:MAG TPA: response regulator transcription factor [Candidatus Limnocylindrales bacterium]|jgi:DNA-binding NarL/FixJ family response regulator|nr:response regulator transcription factor [Candidatus Limnocylindrales bacterium]
MAVTRVLLVDDHPLVRAAVREAVTAPDIEVVGEAATCESAVRATDELRPDVVLLDLDLPDRSGLDYLREVRDRLPEMVVVVLTVSAADRDLVEALRSGAAGYLTKDVAPDAIGRALREAQRGELPIPGRLAATAIKALVRSQADDAPPSQVERLTDREREVLALISDGRTDRETADALGISIRTVEAHVGSILRRTGARNRAEASSMYRSGLARPKLS